jgi:hypothetical protein
MKSYTLDVKFRDDGEAYIELPDEVIEETGWKVGDDLEWSDNGDGSFTLTSSNKEWVLVETVQMFRHRYMVQVPKGKAEWAMDTVVCEEAKEFSQQHLGETIVSHRVVSYEDALKICDQDNDYTKSWSEEQKVTAFFTKDGEKIGN